MSAQSRTTPTSSNGTEERKNRRAGKNAPRRLNRSQQQAMEIRAAATSYTEPTAAERTTTSTEPDLSGKVSAPQTRGEVKARGRIQAKIINLTREQEYHYIRADLYRLLLTAAGLAVLMIILLFVVEH